MHAIPSPVIYRKPLCQAVSTKALRGGYPTPNAEAIRTSPYPVANEAGLVVVILKAIAIHKAVVIPNPSSIPNASPKPEASVQLRIAKSTIPRRSCSVSDHSRRNRFTIVFEMRSCSCHEEPYSSPLPSPLSPPMNRSIPEPSKAKHGLRSIASVVAMKARTCGEDSASDGTYGRTNPGLL